MIFFSFIIYFFFILLHRFIFCITIVIVSLEISIFYIKGERIMTNLVNEIIEKNMFNYTGGNHIFTNGTSTFTIFEDYQVNDKYRARKYVIQTSKSSLHGIIYTSDIRSFEQTLHRLMFTFSEYHSKAQKIENIQKNIVEVLEDIQINKIDDISFLIGHSIMANYVIEIKVNSLGVNLFKKTENEISLLDEKYFNPNETREDIEERINALKTLTQQDISKSKLIPFVS